MVNNPYFRFNVIDIQITNYFSHITSIIKTHFVNLTLTPAKQSLMCLTDYDEFEDEYVDSEDIGIYNELD